MKRVMKAASYSVVVAACCLMWAASVSAGIVNYNNVSGANVDFTNIVETSTGVGPMYGQPVADFDTLVSQGIGFLAQSVAGQVVMVDGRLQLVITADAGFVFDEVNVETIGSYFGFTPQALAMANSFTTVELNGDFYSNGELYSESGAVSTDWGGDYTISFPETNQIFLTLNTQLLATSSAQGASFIEASSIRISINAFQQSIPEPSTTWCLAIGLAALATRRRRRS